MQLLLSLPAQLLQQLAQQIGGISVWAVLRAVPGAVPALLQQLGPTGAVQGNPTMHQLQMLCQDQPAELAAAVCVCSVNPYCCTATALLHPHCSALTCSAQDWSAEWAADAC
jgi:hypothetical protein